MLQFMVLYSVRCSGPNAVKTQIRRVASLPSTCLVWEIKLISDFLSGRDMRSFLLGLIVCAIGALASHTVAAGGLSESHLETTGKEPAQESSVAPDAAVDALGAVGESSCGSKSYCKDMRTCSEAVHYLEDCGLERLDADNDGIPCESICGKTKATMSARVRAQPWSDDGAGDPSAALALAPETAEESFTCGKKRTCRQMESCEEARFYLESCGC